MKYVDKPQQLGEVAEILAGHQSEIRQYFLGQLQARLTGVPKLEDRLRVLFVIANADRRGMGKENDKLQKATAIFQHNIIPTICADGDPGVQHERFLSRLCEVSGMKQKTANLFIKYLATFQDELGLELLDWRSWEPYLHVPLDLWVLRLLGKSRLAVCGDEFEERFAGKNNDNSYVAPGNPHSAEYRDLQRDLALVASSVRQPAIVFDSLWFIGSKYCALRPLLCEVCWVKGYCQRKSEVARSDTTSEVGEGTNRH